MYALRQSNNLNEFLLLIDILVLVTEEKKLDVKILVWIYCLLSFINIYTVYSTM